jgi:DNA-binding LytR/AlgR family response regulator
MTPTALPRPTALIAEDEPLLAAALAADLAAVWPELHVVATVGDGLSAVTQALALQPDVLFFDIRMPGQTGLDAAAELADAWPADGAKPFPALVFVTAYDHYALAAFDAQAVDYLVKPVQRERLQKCANKIAPSLSNKQVSATDVEPQQHTPSAQQLSQIAALLAQLNGTAPPTRAPRGRSSSHLNAPGRNADRHPGQRGRRQRQRTRHGAGGRGAVL